MDISLLMFLERLMSRLLPSAFSLFAFIHFLSSYLFQRPWNRNRKKNLTKTRYVVFLSGIITVTIPETNQTATFTGGGANSIFIAADTQDKSTNGHVTGTGDKPVTLLQMPFLGGVVPEYRVLYNGACRKKELGFV